MLLLDVNHGIKNVDIMLMDMLKEFQKNFIIVYTKCDKASEITLRESEELAHKLQ
jgi:GTP-binding protein EngB required for normal cell division